MKNLLTLGIGLVVGGLGALMLVKNDVEDGDVVYNDEQMYVKASKSKSYGWSYAEVHWKEPIEK